MKQSNTLGLNLPEANDVYDVEHFNENSQKIDVAIKEMLDAGAASFGIFADPSTDVVFTLGSLEKTVLADSETGLAEAVFPCGGTAVVTYIMDGAARTTEITVESGKSCQIREIVCPNALLPEDFDFSNGLTIRVPVTIPGTNATYPAEINITPKS